MPPSSVTNGSADSCAIITARQLEFFGVAGRGRVLHRRAIVSARFGGDGDSLLRINSRSLVGPGDLQSEFTAIKKLVCYGNRRRLVF